MISLLEKQDQLIKIFNRCGTPELKYQKIIELGKALPEMPADLKTEENRVHGCQSIVHLHAQMKEGKIYFTISSDALISSGLAMLLIKVYEGESPEIIIKHKPLFLDELGITTSLSPGRSNGLASIFLRMQKEALKFLIQH